VAAPPFFEDNPHAHAPVRQVESEARLLMERLRSLAVAAPFAGSAIRGRDPESVVPKAAPKDKSVVDYLAISSSLVSVWRGGAKMGSGAVR